MDIENDPAADRGTALVEKLLADTIATFELAGVYLGLRLGLYRTLAAGPASSPDLASRADVDERYAREWLEQQAVAGILEVDDPDGAPDQRRYGLPAEHREVLLDETSPSFAGPLAYVASIGGILPQLREAYRTGGGIPFADYGVDIRDHIEQLNRPMFESDLGSAWIPAMPDLHKRLDSDPPARVLDLACGAGWSSIAIARAYPAIHVDGIDLDPASIDKARANAATAGLTDRIDFTVADAADRIDARSPGYDAVLVFEALHDMARPVDALAAARAVLAPGGSVLVGDEKVAERFAAPGEEIDRLMYGFSIVHCLPAGRVDPGSAATGTIMRPELVRRYAHDAGFSTVDVLPVENDMWRFYRLRES